MRDLLENRRFKVKKSRKAPPPTAGPSPPWSRPSRCAAGGWNRGTALIDNDNRKRAARELPPPNRSGEAVAAGDGSEDEETTFNGDDMFEGLTMKAPPKPRTVANVARNRYRSVSRKYNVPRNEYRFNTDADCERWLAFCCRYNCHCPMELKIATGGGPTLDDSYVTSSANSLWHRRCCHRVYDQQQEGNDSWASPMESMMCNGDFLGSAPPDEAAGNKVSYVSSDVLLDEKRKADRQESQILNENDEPVEVDILNTSRDYASNLKAFTTDKKRRENPAVVLDLFAGVGTGIVALKQLGISIGTVIHVEKDKVATFVYQENHDAETQESGPPIKHDYVETFEEIEDNIDGFVRNHVPAYEDLREIDIVLGGPPCTDYSGVNARRKGASGEQGSYLIRVGKLIKQLQDRQKRQIYFVIENVGLSDQKYLSFAGGDLQRVKDAFGISWDPVILDAKDFSPCRRHRCFFSNIPLLNYKYMQYSESRHAVNRCLQDGFSHPGSILDRNMVVKANTFMAHKGRLDDERMAVYRQEQGTAVYKKRSLSVCERERMMGFPDGYVERPVNDLFKRLLQDGYDNILTTQKYWHDKDGLPQRLHKFSGDFHGIGKSYDWQTNPPKYSYNFVQISTNGDLELELALPPTGSQVQHLDKEQYGKHLIGNAYSVVIAEILLRPLSTKFLHAAYPGYPYTYKWKQSEALPSPLHLSYRQQPY